MEGEKEVSEEKKTPKESEKATQLSRREFLKDAGICAGCAAIGGAALLSGCKNMSSTVTSTVASTVTKTATVSSPPVTTTVTGPGATVTTTATSTAAPATFTTQIINPSGDTNVKYLFAKRLDTLAGKTVAFHACAPTKWQPHRIFPYIADKLLAKYPTMKVIPMTEFTAGAGIDSAAVAKSALDKGANAVINGFAA